MRQKRFCRERACAVLTVLILAVSVLLNGCADKESGSHESQEPQEQALQAGTYEPSLFRAEGGTGKVKITCPEVIVTDGSAEAVITFSSPYYEWVKKDGITYEPLNAEEEKRETSSFRIPVLLDETQTISGLTTAMSQPHEIEYTIFISLTQNEEEAYALEEEEELLSEAEDKDPAASNSTYQTDQNGNPVLSGLSFVSERKTDYAETFKVYDFILPDEETGAGADRTGTGETWSDDLYHLIDVHDSAVYLLVPENGPIPEELPEEITILRKPLQNLYVAATSSMALFDAAGAIETVKFTGTDVKGWYIDAPKKALESGSMRYAGKYSAPDYELLGASGCGLAVESLMILHTPEVKEKLEELGIPVFIDTSSRESHPLGRTEWILLYGLLTGHVQEAQDFFAVQKAEFEASADYEDTGKSVAFFSISSNGNVIVRSSGDYIPKMIELAGGRYIFDDLTGRGGISSSVRLTMEEFYNTAKDADYLIYNATIEKPVKSVRELCGKFSLLSEFKAVQEGNVWQIDKNLYQSPDIAAQMIGDIHRMLTGEEGMVFLGKVE